MNLLLGLGEWGGGERSHKEVLLISVSGDELERETRTNKVF